MAAAICQYNITNDWTTGYQAEISITNDGDEPITDWQLAWPVDEGLRFGREWDATYDCSENRCAATPPSWFPTIAVGTTYRFGFLGEKSGTAAVSESIVTGDICGDGTLNNNSSNNIAWPLDGDRSSFQYVSTKGDHTAEINTFTATEDEDSPLQSSITPSGEAVFSINLNHVETGVDIRNSRLLSLLFETEWLPTAYFRSAIDADQLTQMASGDIQLTTLTGELNLHGVRQEVTADILIVKKSNTTVQVSTVKPILIDSRHFDMASG